MCLRLACLPCRIASLAVTYTALAAAGALASWRHDRGAPTWRSVEPWDSSSGYGATSPDPDGSDATWRREAASLGVPTRLPNGYDVARGVAFAVLCAGASYVLSLIYARCLGYAMRAVCCCGAERRGVQDL